MTTSRMRSPLSGLALALASLLACVAPEQAREGARGAAPPLEARWRATLPVGLPPGSVGRCNGAYPTNDGPTWTPPAELVERIDARLASVLDDALTRLNRADPQYPLYPGDYYRQYAGISVRGERLVYVNGFHRSLLDRDMGLVADDSLEWRNFPVSVCDAGATMFGVVFRVRADAFDRLEFTDRFTGPVRY